MISSSGRATRATPASSSATARQPVSLGSPTPGEPTVPKQNSAATHATTLVPTSANRRTAPPGRAAGTVGTVRTSVTGSNNALSAGRGRQRPGEAGGFTTGRPLRHHGLAGTPAHGFAIVCCASGCGPGPL